MKNNENKIFTPEELEGFNTFMIEGGAPDTLDNVGYNKIDFNFYVTMQGRKLSNKQLAFLAKGLYKYCKTQLNLNPADMRATQEYYKSLVEQEKAERAVILNQKGIKLQVIFKFDKEIISLIKQIPGKWYHPDIKTWTIPLEALETAKEVFTNNNIACVANLAK